jgi:thioredoxin 1
MKTAKYFTATWCGPCQSFKPVMNEISGEGYNIEFVDVDKNQSTAQSMGVRSVPCTIIFEDGLEVDRFVGARSKSEVIKKLS